MNAGRSGLLIGLALASVVGAAEGQAVGAGPTGGVTVTSADESFRLTLDGKIQALYQLDAPDPAWNAVRYGVDGEPHAVIGTRSIMRVRRGRLAFSGHVFDPAWQYKVQVELVGSALTLKDAYVNWRGVGPAAQLRVGQFKVPFGRGELTSVFKQQLVDRSVVSGAFADGWDAGAMVWGRPLDGRVEYYAGVFNGEGANRSGQQDAANEWAARLVWTPVGAVGYDATGFGARGPGLALGLNGRWNGGWLYDVDGVPGLTGPMEICTTAGCAVEPGDDARVATVGADAAVRWGPISATAEVFGRRVDPRHDGAASLTSRGWYVDAGALVSDRIEAGLRYGRLDPDTDRSADRVTEVAPFGVVYLRGHDLKLQADHTWLITEESGAAGATTLTDRRFRLQMILAF